MDIIRRAFQKLTSRSLSRRTPDGVTGSPIRVYRASAAGSVRAVAGAPIGLAPSPGSRRGTVLIIVLGTLALIAVIAVTYAVVGRADRRASAAFVGSVQREEMPALVRDYIANIVGKDAIATYRDGGGVLRREAFDYPFTDPMFRSIPAGQTGVTNMQPVGSTFRSMVRFSPEGTFSDEVSGDLTMGGVVGMGSRGTPYAILVPSDPWLASTQATNLRLDDDVPDDGFPQYNMRDWANITNVSPDGRFVNLWNLRNNFTVSSGFEIVPNPNAANFKEDNQISSRLTLNGPNGMPFTATAPQIRDDGVIASPNIPAHWTDRQRGAFRPATGVPSIGWSEAEHPSYQWADADGDGFFDSRWFEFIDLSQGVDDPRAIFPTDPNYRWFAAVRVVDLSAAVNVNTATDFLSAAEDPDPLTEYEAPGGTPADIDLRRLLTGEDTLELSGILGIATPPLSAYAGLRPPSIDGNPNAVNTASSQYTGAIMQFGLPAIEGAEWIGDAAYNNIRYFLEYGLVTPPQIRLEPDTFPAFITYLNQQHGRSITATDLLRPQFIETRRELYDTITGQGTDLSVSLFGIDSEGELLTFRGANDPGFTSTLELVADGRLGAAPALTRHGPFRSSRNSFLEIAQRDRSDESGGLVALGTLEPEVPDGIADLDAMTQVLVDLRQYVTTLSAARPIMNSAFAVPTPNRLPPLSDTDVPLLLQDNPRVASPTPLLLTETELFSIYANALLPFSDILETWADPTTALGQQYRTLAYGHNGSELALRHAAHMTLNMIDAADNDTAVPEPMSVRTLLVDESIRSTLDAGGAGLEWSVWADGDTLDLGAARLADTSQGSTVINPAVNIYGFEFQPFLTEVAGLIVYTDAPQTAGSSTEPPTTPITINGDVLPGNPDLAYQAVAFQVTNPFNEDIELAGAAGEFKYYIEFNDRFYRFPQTDGILPAGDTRVFYVPARQIADDVIRWNAYEPSAGANLPSFINAMMGVVGGDLPVELIEFDPLTGADEGFAAGLTFVNRFDPGEDLTQARLWKTYLSPSESFAQNNTPNDYLADRLRSEPSDTFENLHLDPGDNPVAGTVVEIDDTGYTVMLWSSMMRPSDPTAAGTTPDTRDWLPAYCVERKFTTSLNLQQEEGLDRSSLTTATFSSTTGETSFALFVGGATGTSFITTLATRAEEKTPNPMPSNAQSKSWTALRSELYMGLGDTMTDDERTLRPFDLLLARGLGASLAVDSTLTYNIDGWTTLGEATALAFDYDAEAVATTLMPHPGRPANDPQGPGTLDRGHIVFDQFVPFFDVTASDPPVFDPDEDYAYGDGMPLAMGIVQAVRSLGDSYGNVRRAIPGLININTAPLAVLRTLPMLSPSHGADPATFAATPPTGWWGDLTGQGLDSDIASMVEAYRDNVTRFPRFDPAGTPPSLVEYETIDFEVGRRTTSAIPGIREIPGFRSVGEVLAARDGATRAGVGLGASGPHDIDRLGLDSAPQSMLGFDPTVTFAGTVDTLVDEMDERLAIANSIANSITVRSDVFAVWFVLHGYRESDCTGLATDDPLIPGVSRRFLMILDRSNVLSESDKPAILLFKEVPYSPTSAGDGSAI